MACPPGRNELFLLRPSHRLRALIPLTRFAPNRGKHPEGRTPLLFLASWLPTKAEKPGTPDSFQKLGQLTPLHASGPHLLNGHNKQCQLHRVGRA